jgi:hypothetical protein
VRTGGPAGPGHDRRGTDAWGDGPWDDGYWEAVDALRPAGPAGPAPGWRQRSAAGAVAAAMLLGLREALEPEPPDEAIVEIGVAPAEPVGDVELRFDEGSPRRTVAVVR